MPGMARQAAVRELCRGDAAGLKVVQRLHGETRRLQSSSEARAGAGGGVDALHGSGAEVANNGEEKSKEDAESDGIGSPLAPLLVRLLLHPC